jgi:hypothetical protein
VFGRLTILDATQRTAVLCRCECGSEKTYVGYNLHIGNTTSCGCLHSEQMAERNFKHGRNVTDYRYNLWKSMKARCYNPRRNGFKYYGGRGIEVYEWWRSDFEAFARYLDEELGPRPEGCSLDRIDTDGNYEPGNIRWATALEQRHNRRNDR